MNDKAAQSIAVQTQGGRIALRGFIGQTLYALYQVLSAEPAFTVLTLEPDEGNDKFDYTWDDEAGGRFAVQVKTTQNQFTLAQVRNWAEAMATQPSTRTYSLCLMGAHESKLKNGDAINGVNIKITPLDLDMLQDAIATKLANFTGLASVLPAQVANVFSNAVCNQLFHRASHGREWTRTELTHFLQQTITHGGILPQQIDAERVLRYAPDCLLGREGELAHLHATWQNISAPTAAHDKQIISIIAIGGEGKTSLLAHWMRQMQEHDWAGAKSVFAWSFYSQGASEQNTSSADLFLHEALIFFGEAELANSSASSWDKGKKVAQCCTRQRTLLLLDGLEPLQYAPTSPTKGELKDQGLLALLRNFAAKPGNSLCVLTSRYALPQIQVFCSKIDLPRLPQPAAVQLLRSCCPIGREQDYQAAVEEVRGHALSLHIIAHYIQQAYGGDIRQRDLVNWQEADKEATHGHAFRAMAAYRQWLAQDKSPHSQRALALLYALSLFDRPAETDLLNALLAGPCPCTQLLPLQNLAPRDWNLCIHRLQQAKLLTSSPELGEWHTLQTLEMHPLLREYFAQHWQQNDLADFQAGHKRLFDYLQTHTKEGSQPSLQDLQPLYQALTHGCLAGLYSVAFDKVYGKRILRDEAYRIAKLGAYAADLAALAVFFNEPWHSVVSAFPVGAQAWLLSAAAFRLFCLGRLAEALPIMQMSLKLHVGQQDWKYAAHAADMLAELLLQQGKINLAIGQAQQAVTYADKSRDGFSRMDLRATLGNCLHQSGQVAEAQAAMEDAEYALDIWQMGLQGYAMMGFLYSKPQLYSSAGFHYCELLLINGLDTRAQIADRASHSLDWAEGQLCDIGLDHLTLARCAQDASMAHAQKAVTWLRQAGESRYLPSALLMRAEMFCTLTPTRNEAAQADLDEAFEICERSGSKLLLCDTLLARVALFAQQQAYPWGSPQADLAQARKLVDACGYERRRAALAEPQRVLWLPRGKNTANISKH